MLEISSALLHRIAGEAAASPGHEVCGLLFGSSRRIVAARACRNVAWNAARRFEIDPSALIAAHRAMRDGGEPLAGCYHSHPGGSAEPSRTDAAQAEPNGWVWLIQGRSPRVWRAVEGGRIHGRFDPVELIVRD